MSDTIQPQHATSPTSPIIYSNRAPDESLTGGAVRVIIGRRPHHWVAPGANIRDTEWRNPDISRKMIDYPEAGSHLTTHTFTAPDSLHDAHYNEMSNRFLWPLLHSMTPWKAPDSEPDNAIHPQDHRFKAALSMQELNEAWEQYKEFNAIGSGVLQELREDHKVGSKQPVWVHDYQCVGVKGDVFSFHTPFPSVGYLDKVRVDDTQVLRTEPFKEYIQELTNYKLISFQRAVDMKNFLETLNALDRNFHEKNQKSGIFEEGNSVKGFDIGDGAFVEAFGHKFRVMNFPVGITREDVQKAADAFVKGSCVMAESASANIRKTRAGYEKAGWEPEILEKVEKRSLTLEDILGSAQEPGHRILAALTRNDYTKNTLEKLEATKAFFQQHPEEVGHTHFVYFLEFTRDNVAGYKEYADAVFSLAKELHKQYGNSVAVLPGGGNYNAIMKLLQHPNTVCVNAASAKDGFELTGSEAVHVNACEKGHPLSVIVSDGIGSCDVLSGSKDKPGAFVVKSDQSHSDMVNALASTYAEIVQLSKDNSPQMQERFDVMKDALEKYTSKSFGEAIMQNLRTAQQAQSTGRKIG